MFLTHMVLPAALVSFSAAPLLAQAGVNPNDRVGIQTGGPEGSTHPTTAPGVDARLQKMLNAGAKFLLSQQQADGSWQRSPHEPVGITALVLKALVQVPGYEDHPAVKKGYAALLANQLDSGGIYKSSLASYNTAIAVSALAASGNKEYDPQLKKAVEYLKSLQWNDSITGPKGEKVVDASNAWYGGWGYGGMSRGAGRPDLSNTQMAIDALKDAGIPPEDPAYKAAAQFISRLQNFSETNDRDWVGNDGGFIYGPSDNGKGESMAGEYTGADGKRLLRSYGSMTYAGLKSMIYAGLSKDDPRVKAAWAWISQNWSLDENPGMRLSKPENAAYGMYYYYHTLARALAAYGEKEVITPDGQKHDWRAELEEKLSSLQRPDGSWVGEKKWMEDNPVLTTSYVLLALQATN
jgi:squalene-hopene/tetraprenyl-beta-curcumene cyclase